MTKYSGIKESKWERSQICQWKSVIFYYQIFLNITEIEIGLSKHLILLGILAVLDCPGPCDTNLYVNQMFRGLCCIFGTEFASFHNKTLPISMY